MAQMMKQFGQDRSLQQDWFAGPSQNHSPSVSMRTGGPQAFTQGDMVNDFFGQEQANQRPQQQQRNMGAFELSQLHRELETIGGPVQQQQQQQQPSAGWASEFQVTGRPNEEALAMERAFIQNQSSAKAPLGWQDDFANNFGQAELNPQQKASFDTAFRNHYGWSGEFSMQHPTPLLNQQQNINEKGRILELDQQGWEDQFAAFDLQRQEQQPELTEEEIAKQIEEEAAKNPAALEEFESIWQDLKDQMAKGESDVDEGDDWEDEFGNFGPNGATMYKPDLGEYVFEIENPYMDEAHPMTVALEMLANQTNGGDNVISLSELALALEAAVQRDPTNSDIWAKLGNIQAQNEKEEAAIRALEKAVEIDPSNYPALMSLAVSYTNESYDHAAYHTLERWITEKYPNVVGATPLPAPATPYELQERVTDLFLKAAQMAPDAQSMDPDVQVGLGVLFYGGGDLEKAIDCFFVAVKGRPDDFLLWNRLGATLANNGRSEDAIEAYHRALELCPSFVRARYNLGVSCLNIGCYKEAAEHLLTGLSMHKRGLLNNEEGINVSRNLWDMLRKSLNMMDRQDLAAKAVPGADINQFRNDFEF
ncbi:hypothetical protein BC941DRAFT_345079 [Chlamydoabsidia padenii]|nr:hypothetical protein BC941DRAFT_345079 [Chlamydoabsidia padenii]